MARSRSRRRWLVVGAASAWSWSRGCVVAALTLARRAPRGAGRPRPASAACRDRPRARPSSSGRAALEPVEQARVRVRAGPRPDRLVAAGSPQDPPGGRTSGPVDRRARRFGGRGRPTSASRRCGRPGRASTTQQPGGPGRVATRRAARGRSPALRAAGSRAVDLGPDRGADRAARRRPQRLLRGARLGSAARSPISARRPTVSRRCCAVRRATSSSPRTTPRCAPARGCSCRSASSTFDNGSFSLVRHDVDRRPHASPGCGAGHRRLRGPVGLDPSERGVAQPGDDPSLRRQRRARASQMWKWRTGEDVDGVLAIDPVGAAGAAAGHRTRRRSTVRR